MIPKIFHAVRDPETVRFDLSKPYWRAGVLYATDGRVAIRHSCTLDALEPYRKLINAAEWGCKERYPRVADVFDRADLDVHTVVVPIPDIERTHDVDEEEHVEEHAHGFTIHKSVCVTGNMEAVLVKPDDADWEGEGVAFAAYYLALLKRHGVEMIHLHAVEAAALKEPGYFAGKDFDGLLMPKVADKDKPF